MKNRYETRDWVEQIEALETPEIQALIQALSNHLSFVHEETQDPALKAVVIGLMQVYDDLDDVQDDLLRDRERD